MRHLEKTISLLYSILEKNYRDYRIYSNASNHCKRLIFRNFFLKVAHQKKSFCKRIKKEIEFLENQNAIMGQGKITSKRDWKNVEGPILPVFRIEKDGIIKECYHREKQNIGLYQNLLSKISLGDIREMLLFQKHSIQLIVQEIEGFGLNIYRDIEAENNNEEEMRYG
ncbi:MAG: hypothetical protein ACQEWG_05775 [Bacteroidota bacterium]